MVQAAIRLSGLPHFPQKLKAAMLKRPLVLRARLYSSSEIKVYQLQQRQQRLEAKACALVEDCRSDVRRQIEAFFDARNPRIDPLVEAMLAGKVKWKSPIFERVVAPDDIGRLIKEIRHAVQHRIKQHFGVVPVMAVADSGGDCRAGGDYIDELFREYLASLKTMELAAKFADKACEESAGRLPYVVQFIIEQADLGTAFMRLIGCCASQHRLRYRQVMAAQLKGLLDSIKHRLTTELCLSAANCCYELYDLLWELPYEQELTRLHSPAANQRQPRRFYGTKVSA